jgi:DNA polymerase/3'-5' exonuclease PolX
MNNLILQEFNKLLQQIKFEIDSAKNKKEEIKNTFRYQSIKKAIDVINKYPKKINKGEDIQDLAGVGKGIVARINEIINTGSLAEIKSEVLENKYNAYIEELEKIHGIGRKTALELYKKYNIKSIKELKDAYINNKIPDLPETIIKGLKYFELIKGDIPRQEIEGYHYQLLNILYKIDIKLFGTICGSFRRLKMVSQDIDFLIIHPDIKTIKDIKKKDILNKIINKLYEEKFIQDAFTTKDITTKFMGITNTKPMRRIDIRIVPYESYYYALLYFTGSGEFNRKMRQIAIDNGYTLNEYGLYDEKGKLIPVKSEKEIFDILGMEYVTPDKR